jgi:ubiquinone/menaquinone biosynthesis C-methylase UbiE
MNCYRRQNIAGGRIVFHRWLCPYCPAWFISVFDNPLRKLLHDPQRLLSPYVLPGMTVLDIGCGAGYFSLGLAKLVGERGKVICLDLQAKMLDRLLQRARRLGVDKIIAAQQVEPDNLGKGTAADFALAFWMVHEVADKKGFFTQAKSRLRPGGKLLMVEPKGHVPARMFADELAAAAAAGWAITARPRVAISRAVLLA